MPPRLTTARRASTLIFFALVMAYVGWMLSLPAWPSQDGPVHLYYTRVLDTIFFHTTPLYGPFLYIKHLLPPYAVYYYTLLALSHVVPLITADRLVICLYLVSFAFGFRYAASAIGPGANRSAPLACVLLLNWSLGMGFANFCLSLSFALWAIGLWLRFPATGQLGKRILFVFLLALITLSHPVPLLIVLAFGGLDLLCRFFAARGADGRAAFLKASVANLVTLAAGALCLLYVKVFTVAHPLEQRTAMQGSAPHRILARVGQIATAKSLCLLYGHWWQVILYRAGLVVLLLVPAALAAVQFRRDRQARSWTPASTCFVFLMVLAVALPILPSDLSGAYFFSERLTVMLWILALLAASAWEPKRALSLEPSEVRARSLASQRADWSASAFAVLMSVLLLHLADVALRPLAERDRLLAQTSLPQLAGQRALVLAGTDVPPGFDRLAPAWNPFQWEAVALLRRNEGILENAPWLDSPIIPLAPMPMLGGAWLPRLLANSPFELTSAVEASPALRQRLFEGAGVVLVSPSGPGGDAALRELLPASWSCSGVSAVSVQVCGVTRAKGK